jgi:hypothetical protein
MVVSVFYEGLGCDSPGLLTQVNRMTRAFKRIFTITNRITERS